MNSKRIDEYKLLYKSEELTDDGIPTIETQLREIHEADQKYLLSMTDKETIDKKRIRSIKQMVKCICLNKMNKSIMVNTLSLNKSERETLQKLMYEYDGEINEEQIRNDFYKVASNELFEDNYIDVSKVPIYDF